MNQEEVSKLEVLLDSTTHPVQVRCLRQNFPKATQLLRKLRALGLHGFTMKPHPVQLWGKELETPTHSHFIFISSQPRVGGPS